MNASVAEAAEKPISKSEFARRRNVSPGRVSQWIAEKKITAAALVGEGRAQQILEAVAVEDLKRNLDILQRAGNGLGTNLQLVPAALAPASAPPGGGDPAIERGAGGEIEPIQAAPAAPRAAVALDPIEEGIKRQRLEQLQRTNRKAAEEEAARAGRFVETDQVRAQFGKIAAQIVTVYEAAIPELATAIAAEFKIPQRDVLHLMRREMRTHRANAAAALKRTAADMPALVETDLAQRADAIETLDDIAGGDLADDDAIDGEAIDDEQSDGEV